MFHFPQAERGASVQAKRSRRATPSVVCVDLDGTLIKTDTLWESLLLRLKSRPWELVLAFVWLCHGKAYFKRQLAARVVPDPVLLPYRSEVLASLNEFKAAGKKLILATAADERVAAAVASHLNLFDGVLASDGVTNCSGQNKLFAIRRQLGSVDFAYWGDSRADLPLWQAAGQAYVVAPSASLWKAVQSECAPAAMTVLLAGSRAIRFSAPPSIAFIDAARGDSETLDLRVSARRQRFLGPISAVGCSRFAIPHRMNECGLDSFGGVR